ncbi:MAG: Rieske (2Fe-2S) protein [Pseudomonadales bacterium]|nr:Rieske (2Fe-2S) protein [Pseudomonadales bacterium]
MIELCHIDDIKENSSRGFNLEQGGLFVVKKHSQIYVYSNSCPHIGIPLEFQPDEFLDKEKNYIQCANHGALFEINTGHCIVGPCTGQALKAIPFKIENNKIILT